VSSQLTKKKEDVKVSQISIAVPAGDAYLIKQAAHFLLDAALHAAQPEQLPTEPEVDPVDPLGVPLLDDDISPPVENVEAAFAPVPIAPAPAPIPEVIEYKMTEQAGNFSREAYISEGWTDAMLIEHGYMIEIKKPVAPAPAPAPAAPLPIAPPAPTVSSVAPPVPTIVPTQDATARSEELDSDGLPWDARIHSGERTKKVDGVWKVKRGTPPELVAQVLAELREKYPAKSIPAASAATAPTATPPAQAPTVNEFVALIQKINPAVVAKTLTQADVLAAVQSVGLVALKDLGLPQNAHLISAVKTQLFPV